MGRMVNPHGGVVSDRLLDLRWTAGEAARRLGMARMMLSPLLRGHTGTSSDGALALEQIDWSDAERWLWLHASCGLTRPRRKAAA